MGNQANHTKPLGSLWNKALQGRMAWAILSLVLVGVYIALLNPRTEFAFRNLSPNGHIQFDMEGWSVPVERHAERKKYVPDLLGRWIKNGVTRDQVRRLLGTPSVSRDRNIDGDNGPATDHYTLGGYMGCLDILIVAYDSSDTVIKAYQDESCL